MRSVVMFGLAITVAGAVLSGGAGPALAEFQAACAKPVQAQGFRTCADIAKAEAEGSVTIYSGDPQDTLSALTDNFHKAFPKIDANFVRLASGTLYARLLAEKQAGNVQADVVMLADAGLTLDFQKRKGFELYVSPELDVYDKEYVSAPIGYSAWATIAMSGLAYNPGVVSPDQAPKNWKDLTNSRFDGGVSFKDSTSGTSHLLWYTLRQLYGADYWKHFEQTKAPAYNSFVPQYEKIINGTDKVAATAAYNGYLPLKAKGAPVNFVFPPDGMVPSQESTGGVAGSAHPEARHLFLDWLFSHPGQVVMAVAHSAYSARPDVPAPEGGEPITQMKMLDPGDYDAFQASKVEFNREWKIITGQ